MDVYSTYEPRECIQIFQDVIKQRPLRLRMFPFKCERPQINGDSASIAASFKLAQPYGSVVMHCERVDDLTRIVLSTEGNMRGRVTAKSMAKAIARQQDSK